ncbi:hypothetical protein YC2023_000198 [Brassica napus]
MGYPAGDMGRPAMNPAPRNPMPARPANLRVMIISAQARPRPSPYKPRPAVQVLKQVYVRYFTNRTKQNWVMRLSNKTFTCRDNENHTFQANVTATRNNKTCLNYGFGMVTQIILYATNHNKSTSDRQVAFNLMKLYALRRFASLISFHLREFSQTCILTITQTMR